MERTKTINITQKEVKNICEQFSISDDYIVKDTDECLKMKKAMARLDRSDFVIMSLYAELQSERALASILGVSRTPINHELKRIRKILKGYLEDDKKAKV